MKIITVVLVFCLAFFTVNGQSINNDIENIVNNIHLSYPDIPGLVIGVHHPVYGEFIVSDGVDRIGGNTPIDPYAKFGIGSVHKNFMWVLMHKLHQESLLDINNVYYYPSPISDEEVFISNIQDLVFAKHGSYFTIADLMKHTTGLVDIPDMGSLIGSLYANVGKEYTLPEIYGYLIGTNQSNSTCGSVSSGMCDNFIKGTDFKYSSYGPVIASVIAEIETGISSRQLEKDYIFDPLGMSSTSHVAYDGEPSNLATGHGCLNDSVLTIEFDTLYEDITFCYMDSVYNFDSGYVFIDTIFLEDSNGIVECINGLESYYFDDFDCSFIDYYSVASLNRYPIFSTVPDLITYLKAQFNDKSFLTQETFDAMKNNYVLWYNMFKVGLGVINYDTLWSTTDVGDDFWGHTGNGIFGHGTLIAHRNSDHLSVVVIANVRPSNSQYEEKAQFEITKAIGEYFNDIDCAMALQYNSFGDKTKIDNSNGSLDFDNNEFSVEVSIQTSNQKNNVVIFNNFNYNIWNVPTNGICIGLLYGRLYFNLFQNGNDVGYFINNGGADLRDGECHHVAATRTKYSGSNDVVRIYIDGDEVASKEINSGQQTGGNNIVLGDVKLGNGFDYVGIIDELRIWNKSLNSIELFGSNGDNLSGEEANLIGYWKFNEGKGQSVEDMSFNSNHAIIGNSVINTDNDPAWQSYCCESPSFSARIQNDLADNLKNRITEENDFALEVYPNPLEEILYVSFVLLKNENEVKISLIDYSGKIVFTEQNNFIEGINYFKTNLSDLSDGVYILQIETGSNLAYKRIIKH